MALVIAALTAAAVLFSALIIMLNQLLTLRKRDQYCSALSADDRIRFPIPNAASAFNNLWTLCDADPTYDLSATLS